MILGLDRFKTVNHSLGLTTADRLLVEVAHRLQACLRATDALTHGGHGFTLARLGGDEFTVLLDDIDDASDAVRVAERLREALQRPFEVEGQQVFVTASAGITVSRFGYTDPEDVLRDAAIALHRAKEGSATRCELFDVGMRDRAVSRLRVETDMRQAIERGAFEVFYQPIITIRGGALSGFEALVRWRHPTQGLIDPADFIPIAEDTEMIVLIGRQVLAQSCQQMVAWQRRFGDAAPRVMCVNVSSKQFADADLTGVIEGVLAESGLSPSSLKLEITESAFLGDIRSAQVTLRRLQSLGVAWSLDDFGTGYSIVELPSPAPRRHGQGGPLIREPHRRRRRIRNGPGNRGDRAQHGHGRRGRRGGDHRTARTAARDRLRIRPGLLLLPPGRHVRRDQTDCLVAMAR